MAMGERLKRTITYAKTFNLGNYQSVKLGVSKEIYQGEDSIEDTFRELAYLVNRLKEELEG